MRIVSESKLVSEHSRSNLDQNWLTGMEIVSEGMLESRANRRHVMLKRQDLLLSTAALAQLVPPLWHGDSAALEWWFRRFEMVVSPLSREATWFKLGKKTENSGKKMKKTYNFWKSLTMSENSSEGQKIPLKYRICENLYPRRKQVANRVLHKSSTMLQS